MGKKTPTVLDQIKIELEYSTVWRNKWRMRRQWWTVLVFVDLVLSLTTSRQASGIECPHGTRATPDGCVRVQIPDNAELSVLGNSWVCKRGYRVADGRCVKVEIPDNAELSVLGNGWVCMRGYKLTDGRCVTVQIPENAE